MGIPLNGKFQFNSVLNAHGLNGVLRSIIDFVCGTEVEAEAAFGTGASWAGTLSNSPVGMGRATLRFFISSEEYEVLDNGEGGWIHDAIETALINYETGEYLITFKQSVDSVEIDYLYGEDGQDWSLLYLRNTRDNSIAHTEPFGEDCKECVLFNTGFSGKERIYIAFREWKYPVSNAWGIDLDGYISYYEDKPWRSYGASYNTSWNRFNGITQIPLVDAPMNYWIQSNRQRIVGAVKVQSNYESFYMGFCNRLCSPSEYPYPLYIRGPLYDNYNFSQVGTLHTYFVDTHSYGIPLGRGVLPNNSWCNNTSINDVISLYPMSEWNDITGSALLPIPSNNQYLVTPVVGLHQLSRSILWELDGVIKPAGILLQSEDVLKRPEVGHKYRIFQNIYRNTYSDFMAIVEEEYTTTTVEITTTTTVEITTTTTVEELTTTTEELTTTTVEELTTTTTV